MPEHRDPTPVGDAASAEMTPAEAEWVIRRAAHIDGVEPRIEHTVSPSLIEDAAIEAGISPEAIRQAIQEHSAVVAESRHPRDSARVRVALPPGEAHDELRRFLSSEGFAAVEFGRSVSTWEPAESTSRSRSTLRGVSRVTLSISALDGGASTVLVRIDAGPRRLLHIGGASAGTAVVAVGGWAAAAGAWPMTVFVGGAGVALAISQVREATIGHRRRLRQAMVALETFLAQL